jgi:hypothetical protein
MWWIIGISVVVVVAVVSAVAVYRKRQIAESEEHYAEQPAVEQDPVAGLRAVNEDEDDYQAVNLVRNPEDRPGGQVYRRQVTMIEQQEQPLLPGYDFNFDGIPDVFEQQPQPTYDEQPAPVDNTPAPDPTPAYAPPAQDNTYCAPDPTPSNDPTPAPDYCPAPDPTPSGNDYGGNSNDYGNSSSTDYGNSGGYDSGSSGSSGYDSGSSGW